MPERVLPTHEPGDTPVYHTVIKFLGSIGILAICGVIGLAVTGKPIPESVVALGSTVVGALVGVLAPSPTKG